MSEVVQWAVMLFPNGGTATVPATWFKPKESTLSWPPKHISYSKALRENMQPYKGWTTYENVRLLITCDSFDKAKRLDEKYVKTGCATTDLESEDEADERRKRRSRPNPRYMESEEEPETSNAKRRFAKPPVFPGIPGSSEYHRTTNASSDSGGLCTEDVQLPDQASNGFCGSYLAELQSSDSFNDDFTQYNPQDYNAPERHCRMEFSQVLKDIAAKKMTTMLAELLVEVKQMSRDIQFLKTEITDIKATLNVSGAGPESQRNFPLVLPLTNEEQFEAEAALKEESVRQKMVSRLALVGGTNTDNMIRRMLSSTITNNLASLFNWKGKGQKRPFQDTLLQDCMFVAARQYDRKLSELTYSDAVKKWLRYAPERKDGIKRKEMSKEI